MLVFVYGTLMRGGCRAGALAGQQFVGPGKTEPRYRMYNCGEFPGLVEADNGRAIEGELWRVTPACLARLDDVEGVSLALYARRPIAMQPPYERELVQGYLYLHEVSGLCDAGHRWVNR